MARLTKKQDKHLVRIRPDLAAGVAWNEVITALDDLARSQVPKTRARERKTTLQHCLHRASGVDTVRTQRVPPPRRRLAVPRGLHSSEFVFEFFPEPNSRFAVRRRLPGWCPTGALSCLHSHHGFIASTGVDNNNNSLPDTSWGARLYTNRFCSFLPRPAKNTPPTSTASDPQDRMPLRTVFDGIASLRRTVNCRCASHVGTRSLLACTIGQHATWTRTTRSMIATQQTTTSHTASLAITHVFLMIATTLPQRRSGSANGEL